MSFHVVEYYNQKLQELLRAAPLEQFLTMIWAADSLQSGRIEAAKRFLSFPPEAATGDPFSNRFIHRWRLETLANEALIHSPKFAPNLIASVLNCTTYDTLVNFINTLNGLENAEYGAFEFVESVLDEVHRLTQRQFEWQIGFSAYSQMYRAAFIYSGEETKQYFEKRYGFTINDLTLFCFALRAAAQDFPAIVANIDLSHLGISDQLRENLFRHVSLYATQATERAMNIRNNRAEVAYRPSVFRAFPAIMLETIPRRVHIPLTELLMLRCTSGLFYDFLGSSGSVNHEVGRNFENYVSNLLIALYDSKYTGEKRTYRHKKQEIETPDVFAYMPLRKAELVIECKGTKMSFDAKFSSDPINSADRGYKEIAKGIFQIWRYVSHKRRGIITSRIVENETLGLVLTLDPWLTMFNRKNDVFELAAQLSARIEPLLDERDKIPIVFSSIDDFESILRHYCLEDIFRAIRAASTKQYAGWLLSSICKSLNPHCRQDRTYPFGEDMGKLLPWWDQIAQSSKAAAL